MDKYALLAWSCALLQLLLATAVDARGAKYLCECYLKKLKAQKLTWKPGRNFHKDFTDAEMRALFGSSRTLMNARSVLNPADKDGKKVFDKSSGDEYKLYPDNFDSREQWPFCNSTISRIKDTGFCASHWAMSVTGALADRLCIQSAGKLSGIQLSTSYLMECCKVCGSSCKGGYPFQAWKFIEQRGIVTGGDYKSHEGCKPYSIESPCIYSKHPSNCTTKVKQSNKKPGNCPKSVNEICVNTNKKFGGQELNETYAIELVRKIPNSDEFTQAWTSEFIKQEIVANGPVTATMRIYDDFFSYKSGVYQPAKIAKKMDDLTVKVIGWGKQGKLEHWITAIPWGTKFGDQGFARIRIGTSALQIDRRMHAGTPKLY